MKIVPDIQTGTPNSTPRRYKKIGKSTYIVTSVFNPNARGDVTDKIARLIEREAAAK